MICRLFIFIVVLILRPSSSLAQEWPVGDPFIENCDGFLVDPGMSAADYGPNTVAISVICPAPWAIGVSLDFIFCTLGRG